MVGAACAPPLYRWGTLLVPPDQTDQPPTLVREYPPPGAPVAAGVSIPTWGQRQPAPAPGWWRQRPPGTPAKQWDPIMA